VNLSIGGAIHGTLSVWTRRMIRAFTPTTQAWRVVKRGGPVFVAAISRWAPRLDGELRSRM
jgi:hypothetical protein